MTLIKKIFPRTNETAKTESYFVIPSISKNRFPPLNRNYQVFQKLIYPMMSFEKLTLTPNKIKLQCKTKQLRFIKCSAKNCQSY